MEWNQLNLLDWSQWWHSGRLVSVSQFVPHLSDTQQHLQCCFVPSGILQLGGSWEVMLSRILVLQIRSSGPESPDSGLVLFPPPCAVASRETAVLASMKIYKCLSSLLSCFVPVTWAYFIAFSFLETHSPELLNRSADLVKLLRAWIPVLSFIIISAADALYGSYFMIFPGTRDLYLAKF